MKYFEEELERVLAEMAELAGWHPTKRERHIIYYNGEDQDIAYGESSEEAIQDFLGKDNGQRLADIHGVTVPEFVVGLTAVRDIPKDKEGDNDFRPADIKLINADKTRRTIENWLNANPTPYRFIIKFGNGTKTQPTPGVITFVKEGNAGGDLLLPHMILHTLGHAVVGYDTSDVSETLSLLFTPILGHRASEDDLIIPMCKLLHMKAAEMTIKEHPRGFPTFQEMMYEVMAVYVKNGRVKVAPNKLCDYKIEPNVCAAIKHILEKFCKEALDYRVGRVVYDE